MSKVLILYDTRTGNTGRMAHSVAEGAKSVGGVERVGAAFGSYGWSGEAPGIMVRALRGQGVRVTGEGVRARRTPGASDLARCRDLGRAVSESVVTNGEQEG